MCVGSGMWYLQATALSELQQAWDRLRIFRSLDKGGYWGAKRRAGRSFRSVCSAVPRLLPGLPGTAVLPCVVHLNPRPVRPVCSGACPGHCVPGATPDQRRAPDARSLGAHEPIAGYAFAPTPPPRVRFAVHCRGRRVCNSRGLGSTEPPPPPPQMGRGIREQAQLTAPFISYSELRHRRRRRFVEHWKSSFFFLAEFNTANDDFSEPPRRADSKTPIFILCRILVRVTSAARGSVSVGFWGARQLSPFRRGGVWLEGCIHDSPPPAVEGPPTPGAPLEIRRGSTPLPSTCAAPPAADTRWSRGPLGPAVHVPHQMRRRAPPRLHCLGTDVRGIAGAGAGGPPTDRRSHSDRRPLRRDGPPRPLRPERVSPAGDRPPQPPTPSPPPGAPWVSREVRIGQGGRGFTGGAAVRMWQ